MDHPAGRSPSLWAEEVPMRDDPLEGLQHIWSVVDEVRDLQLCAMDGFLGSLPAEAEVAGVDCGALEEAVMVEPLPRSRLDPLAAFRYEPHLTLEQLREPGDRFECSTHGRGPQGVVDAAFEEGGVIAAGMRRAIDDHAADVDAQSWRCGVHARIVRRDHCIRN